MSVPDEFILERQGRKYVLYAGLLDAAHKGGLSGIETELQLVPTEENGMTAIVRAVVRMHDPDAMPTTVETRDKTFSGIGDASPENVSRNIVPHIIRMAETRAKARALRDAVSVGNLLLVDDLPEDEVTGGRLGVELAPAPTEPPPLDVSDLASPEQQGYLKGLIRDLAIPRAQFEHKHGAISTFDVDKASYWIDRFQARLDEKRQSDG